MKPHVIMSAFNPYLGRAETQQRGTPHAALSKRPGTRRQHPRRAAGGGAAPGLLVGNAAEAVGDRLEWAALVGGAPLHGGRARELPVRQQVLSRFLASSRQLLSRFLTSSRQLLKTMQSHMINIVRERAMRWC